MSPGWDETGLMGSSGWITAAVSWAQQHVEFQGCVLGPTRVIPQCLVPLGCGAKGCEQKKLSFDGLHTESCFTSVK